MARTVALIAHEAQLDQLVTLIKGHLPVLLRYRLIAPLTTGRRLQSMTELNIECLASEKMGGDIQIAAEVIGGSVRAVIFLLDPQTVVAHDADMRTLIRACQLHDVPLGLNVSTSTLILEGLARTKTAHLIFNPVSGSGNSDNDLSLIHEILDPHFNFHVYTTTPEMDAEQLAKQAVEANSDLVIASGGDGTVSAVAGQLVNTDIPLGIIPRGTANAFCMAVGIQTNITPIRSACYTILEGHSIVVDTARCNGKPMILLAGIGFEAEMVEKASRELKDQWGTLAYIMAGWQQLNEQNLFEVEAHDSEETYSATAGALTVANAAPPTSVLAQGVGEVDFTDGLLDLTIASPESTLEAVTSLIRIFGAALVKTPVNQPNVRHGRVQKITIQTDPPQKVVVDGEMIGTTPVEIECCPKSLRVLVPKR
ncbi:MAG: methylglyoxal synthase [Leptolyngbyaceae bacterium]|nr:methylglyoxal synthase [Leptolyngbyaceae bacterium]